MTRSSLIRRNDHAHRRRVRIGDSLLARCDVTRWITASTVMKNSRADAEHERDEEDPVQHPLGRSERAEREQIAVAHCALDAGSGGIACVARDAGERR